MHDVETQKQFISLRSRGKTFDCIAAELGVSRQTLMNWSRKFQFEIQNLHAIELESLQHEVIQSREVRVRAMAERLRLVEAELKKRDLTELSTTRLVSLEAGLRRQILAETGPLKFTVPIKEIPNEEYNEQVQDWSP